MTYTDCIYVFQEDNDLHDIPMLWLSDLWEKS